MEMYLRNGNDYEIKIFTISFIMTYGLYGKPLALFHCLSSVAAISKPLRCLKQLRWQMILFIKTGNKIRFEHWFCYQTFLFQKLLVENVSFMIIIHSSRAMRLFNIVILFIFLCNATWILITWNQYSLPSRHTYHDRMYGVFVNILFRMRKVLLTKRVVFCIILWGI
jgi:hypothetical protein